MEVSLLVTGMDARQGSYRESHPAEKARMLGNACLVKKCKKRES